MDFFKSTTTGSSDKKRVHKLNRINSEYDDFVKAVEHGNVEKVKNYLETASNDLDINSLTADGLTLLDIAVIQKNRPMVKVLLDNGATENHNCTNESMFEQLEGIIKESEKKCRELRSALRKYSTSSNPTQLKELEKEFHIWEKRYKKFQKMRSEFAQIRPPDPPLKAILNAISSVSVKILIQQDEVGGNSICTKYKIEWSSTEDFRADESHVLEEFDLRDMERTINNLTTGTKYYFRVACGNCAGYGAYLNTTPSSVIPSSWRDLDDNCHRGGRFIGKSVIFDTIFKQVLEARPESASEIQRLHFTNEIHNLGINGHQNLPSAHQPKKNQKMSSIKQLFSHSTKFHKNFKRGVFLSCVMYSEDKLLLTNEEFLPTIEIDETYPNTLQADFNWLLKVACTWENVRSLKQDMEKSLSASTFHFRLKLLQASSVMQNALGVDNLGRVYYKLIRDKTSSVVIISIVNNLSCTKMISSTNLRWTTLSKVSNRKPTGIPNDISSLLMNSIQNQILFHQTSNVPLGNGLYLGYLKLVSSIEHLRIVVQAKNPNILPHCKIRDNPHVTSEEWALIHKMKSRSMDSLNDETNNNMEGIEEASDPQEANSVLSHELTHAQEIFLTEVSAALKMLFSYLEIDYEESIGHRFYNTEVVEMNNCVSMIIVYPAVENVCIGAGQSDDLLTRDDLIAIPIPVFEMIHLNTYQSEVMMRYARLSAVVEVDTILAQHNQREAFSCMEIASAKQRLTQLQSFQTTLDANWKAVRWVMELVTTARNKLIQSVFIRDMPYFDLHNFTESTSSGDTNFQNNDTDRRRLNSKNNMELNRRFVSALGSASLKFSKSENQLDNLELSRSTTPITPRVQSSPPPIHHFVNTRMAKTPVFAKVSENQNHVFNSMHSQSDMTISNSASNAEEIGSASVQNLSIARQSNSCNSSPIRQHTSYLSIPMPRPAFVPTSPSKPAGVNGRMRKMSHDLPPVPHRRTLPPPPPIRMFPALDPPAQESSLPNAQSVKPCDNPRLSWSGSSASCASTPSNGFIADVPPSLSPSPQSPPKLPGVIQVYAAYECGLSLGTSVRLQITGHTTSRQVVDLVVKQLNSEIEAKGQREPVYESTYEFCLVAVIGARERCLRNDFKPLYLQNPWKSGRLYVRKKSDVTAAIEMNGKHGAYAS